MICATQRHRSAWRRDTRGLEQPANRARADEPIDVKHAECEYERIDRAEDQERDCRRARRQKWRHGIGGSQHAKDHPGLTADFSREPAGKNGNERQWKA